MSTFSSRFAPGRSLDGVQRSYGKMSSREERTSRKFSRDSKPSFIIKPRRQFVDEGQRAKFKASFDGVPTPRLEWQRDGVPIEGSAKYKIYSEDDFHFLEIFEVEMQDKVKFSAVISNSMGTEQATADLEVYAKRESRVKKKSPPSFERLLKATTAEEGQQITLECIVTGHPQPSVSWLHNDRKLGESTGVSFSYNGRNARLSLSEVFVEDDGVYVCAASNSEGDAQSQAKLIVHPAEPPPTKQIADSVDVDVQRRDDTIEAEQFSDEYESGGSKPASDEVKLEENLAQNTRKADTTKTSKLQLDSDSPKPPSIKSSSSKFKNDISKSPTSSSKSLSDSSKSLTDSNKSLTNSSKSLSESSKSKAECKSKGEFKPDRKSSPLAEKPPIFTRPLHDQSILDGDSVTLVVEFQSSVEPLVQWFKSGLVVSNSTDFVITTGNGRSQMRIVEVYPEDEGEIACVLTTSSDALQARSVAMLTVLDPDKQLPPQPVPQPGDKSAVTRFPEEQSDDTDSAPPLPVAAPPPKKAPKPKVEAVAAKFVRRLNRKMTVFDGQSVEFVVEVTGSEPLEVVWFFNNKELTGDNVYSICNSGNVHKLYIDEVYPEDAGKFHCEVLNDHGEDDCFCQLAVQDDVETEEDVKPESKNEEEEDFEEVYAPEIIKKPRTANIDEGRTAKFSCQIIGNPQPKVQWLREGRSMADDHRYKISEDGETYCLEIVEARISDAGRYGVAATNSLGCDRHTFTLLIKELEQVESDFRSVLKSRGIGGRKAAFFGSPGSEVPGEQHDFRNVLTRHVKTKRRPVVQLDLQDLRAREGASVTLTCKVTGIPEPQITWFHAKTEIKDGKYFNTSYKDGHARLVITRVYPEDEGDYACRATNEAGMVITSCDVTVIPAPKRSTTSGGEARSASSGAAARCEASEPPFIEDLQPDNVQIVRGGSFTLRGKFQAEPSPSVRWYKAKQEILPGKRVTFEIVRDKALLCFSEAESGDTGKYTLVVENELGIDKCSSAVTVEDRPNPPAARPGVSDFAGSSLTLSWQGPTFDGGSPVIDFRVEVFRLDDLYWRTLTSNCREHSFKVTGLEPGYEYQFRVSAQNKHGFSDPGEVSVTVSTEVKDALAVPTAQAARTDGATDEREKVKVMPNREFQDWYTLDEQIGKGRFGSVFRCQDKNSQELTAAKFIRTRASDREQVRQELDVMNELSHDKLIKLLDAFETPRELILILEYVTGGELLERIINAEFVLTERDAAGYMRQICDGVAHMHSKHVLHLDLKPENVLCVAPASNQIKIIDFGLARKVKTDTQEKVLFGTPEFVAPEVVNYEAIGAGTDMWSIGVMTYVLLSGLSPFTGDQDSDTLANVTMATWDFEDEIFDKVSDDARNFIELLLVKNMKKRMSASSAVNHSWLTSEIKSLPAVPISTEPHRRLLARRKRLKSGSSIRAANRKVDAKTRSTELDSGIEVHDTGSEDSKSVETACDSPDLPTDVSARRRRRDDLTTRRRCDRSTESAPTVTTPATVAATPTVSVAGPASGVAASARDKPEKYTRAPPPMRERSEQKLLSRSEALARISALSRGENNVVGKSTERRRRTDDKDSAIERRRDRNGDDSRARRTPEAVKFIRKLRDKVCTEGETAKLEVKTTGWPVPDVTWYKDGIEITGSRRLVLDVDEDGTRAIHIKSIRASDEGTYLCVLRNPTGEASCSAEVYVETSK